MQICFKIIKYTIVSFFVSSILSVVALRWLPVSITPLMVIRCVQHLAKGEPMAIHHKWVSLDSISPYLPVAVMASEDQNFLHHHGFDFNAIQNAAIQRIEGGRRLGGSTISQQTAKNVFLWPTSSWVRKGLDRTVIAEAVDGTYTIETYKQSSEVTETGTIPSVTTEGRIYSAVMSVEESDAVTSTRYVQAGEMETGDKRL